MGSRAVIIVAATREGAQRRFGVESGEGGIAYTRTGRRFFDDRDMESEVLARIRLAATEGKLWETLETDWLCLDCEVMPWSAKGAGLIRDHYAPVAAAARMGLEAALATLGTGTSGNGTLDQLREHYKARQSMAALYDAAYRRYNWPVENTADLKIAPFHVLASEGQVHTGRDHAWHMDTIDWLCHHDKARHGENAVLTPTERRVVDVKDPEQVAKATRWWEEQTGQGGEGMVVKPLEFIRRGDRGLMSPALKCRGREYLRIIYGPEYTRPEQLSELRKRSTSRKRALALREFALGVEALRLFTARAALRQVHKAVFALLALESEPVDPRL